MIGNRHRKRLPAGHAVAETEPDARIARKQAGNGAGIGSVGRNQQSVCAGTAVGCGNRDGRVRFDKGGGLDGVYDYIGGRRRLRTAAAAIAAQQTAARARTAVLCTFADRLNKSVLTPQFLFTLTLYHRISKCKWTRLTDFMAVFLHNFFYKRTENLFDFYMYLQAQNGKKRLKQRLFAPPIRFLFSRSAIFKTWNFLNTIRTISIPVQLCFLLGKGRTIAASAADGERRQ